MNIKKQIHNLYIYEAVNAVAIADTVWVFFLLQRGFSLAQVGIAEGVFHIVSMCCEIPSGMVADTIGRRKTLMIAGLVSAASCVFMILGNYFLLILVAMGMNAVSYNLVSGTREALTYDSLLQSGEEKQYLAVSSRQETIFQGQKVISGILCFVVVWMGYRSAYLLGAFQGVLCAVAAGRLQEAVIDGMCFSEKISLAEMAKKVKQHFRNSALCLRDHPAMMRRMLVGGGVSAGCYLVFMMLQAHLVNVGLDAAWIGAPLLVLPLCSTIGASFAKKTTGFALERLVLVCGTTAGLFVMMSGMGSYIFSAAAAGVAFACSEILAIRLDNENQKVIRSESRATMVSVDSMVYSILMAALSPAIGAAAEYLSVPLSFVLLGCFIVGIVWGTMGRKGRE